MREILILDSPEISCPYVLTIVFRELCGSLIRKGFNVKVIDKITDIKDNSIVFMGDFINVDNPSDLLYKQSVKAIYIGWYWHKQNVQGLPYFIHVYENVLSSNPKEDKIDMLKFMRERKNTCPLLLRANEDPTIIGLYKRKYVYDYCYMGGKMCTHLLPSNEFNGFCDARVCATEYMSYDERKKIYLSSLFALGLQTFDNCLNEHVSQRIYEGMAYGCVVLSNSLSASKQTDGIVVHFETKTDLENKMRYYIKHPEEIEKKRQLGYIFVRAKGTNEYAIQIIRNTIRKVYSIDILRE